ncbi:MAG TPA: saccharopine dehydrogenase NADP-binding domain-containing protein [Actinomycetes bacterium]|jgi:saccharopine dehydrogenase (NAD+, L-lysine-forming)|nr:saccharopine dehydrogenase NADP-binding domain-containing protein [Actinomycetes bacterium]
MRVVVLGGTGAMGRWTVRDLTESDGVDEVIVAGRDGARASETAGWAAARAGAIGSAHVSAMVVDARDPGALRRALARADVVCNCMHYAFNLPVMEACVDTGTHYVDLGGLFHTTGPQLALHDRFAAAGVTAVIGMGGSPGTTNLMAAHAARDLASVHEVHVRVGMAGFAPWTQPLPVPFAIDTLLDEFSVPAVTYVDGGWTEVPAMSGLEEVDFPAPVGRLALGHALHSEVATLPLYFAERGVRTVSFKIGFPAEFMIRMRLLTGLGLARTEPLEVDQQPVVPRMVLRRCIEATTSSPAAEAGPGDAEAILVRLTGQDRDERPVEVLAECVICPHAAWKAGAGQLDTGVPPSIVAQFLAWGVIDRRGVFAPEEVVPPKPYFEELASRFMEVDLITRTHATDDRADDRSNKAWRTKSRPERKLTVSAPASLVGHSRQATTEAAPVHGTEVL